MASIVSANAHCSDTYSLRSCFSRRLPRDIDIRSISSQMTTFWFTAGCLVSLLVSDRACDIDIFVAIALVYLFNQINNCLARFLMSVPIHFQTEWVRQANGIVQHVGEPIHPSHQPNRIARRIPTRPRVIYPPPVIAPSGLLVIILPGKSQIELEYPISLPLAVVRVLVRQGAAEGVRAVPAPHDLVA